MNKTENIVQYRDIGEVRYVINRRARNLSIRINQQGEVRVTIPRYVSQRRAESFLRSKQTWILKKLNELQIRTRLGRIPQVGDLLNVRGKVFPIELQNSADSAEEAVWRILLAEARDYLPARVKLLAGKHGFEISGVKIRRMKTRWGSCTARGNINLNSWLVILPDHLTDYVILHELVHTRHHDHSPAFWVTLDKMTGEQSKALRKELRGHRIMLIHPE
jgi:predicted metal-dependent hydrolase